MSKRTFRRTGKVIGYGIIVLIIGFSAAWLGGHGYLPLDPQLVVGITLLLFLLTLCLASTTVMASTSFIARQRTSTIPSAPEDHVLSRVIRDSRSGEEIIVQAHPNSTIREVLEDDWPFEKKASGEWYLFDERGNDVSNWPISNWDGIVVIRFEE